MNKRFNLKAALLLAGLLALPMAQAATSLSKADYSAGKTRISADYKSEKAACAALKSEFADATAQEGDGLRLDWSDRWVQVRASNTEPIIRIIAEAPSSDAAKTLCSRAIAAVTQAVQS